jgi:hypothetical protein
MLFGLQTNSLIGEAINMATAASMMLSPITNDGGAGPSGRSCSRSSTGPDGGKGAAMRSGFEANGCASARPIQMISSGKRRPPSDQLFSKLTA